MDGLLARAQSEPAADEVPQHAHRPSQKLRIAAAQVRVSSDRQVGRATPKWIRDLAAQRGRSILDRAVQPADPRKRTHWCCRLRKRGSAVKFEIAATDGPPGGPDSERPRPLREWPRWFETRRATPKLLRDAGCVAPAPKLSNHQANYAPELWVGTQ